ncbi:protein GrpE [Clostridium homopropionicum DSM 5847]|uniref:Protein GrpE n=1 Tax=Clostridium homopropionicum DSM 5847 TaxID=1121318 RepID=A0A0L6ZE50_9CLOT|nr:nucleotide exchange factor GrpE [Clostridium homopropionicum]KOA21245.1 protein GrpE [Clostridium homopropionicum DSM 5847]SFG28495.1 molecular chaperone GrpE [Clostridium homopropionicum]
MVNDENLNEIKEEAINEEDNMVEETLEESEVNEDIEFEQLDQKDKTESEIEGLTSQNKSLAEENKKLSNEVETLKDRLLRINAEYENFRKRTEKEKKALYTDACSDVLKYMFPVLDNLERAAAAEGNAEDLKKGIEITLKQFEDALNKLDVEEIKIEEGFDPNYHNAIMHIEDESYGKNHIVEVFQKGYKKGDKVLRFSLVKVAN